MITLPQNLHNRIEKIEEISGDSPFFYVCQGWDVVFNKHVILIAVEGKIVEIGGAPLYNTPYLGAMLKDHKDIDDLINPNTSKVKKESIDGKIREQIGCASILEQEFDPESELTWFILDPKAPKLNGPSSPPPSPSTGVSLPQDFRDYINELEEWALLNRRDALRDTISFWILKIPAILSSASAGVWAHFDFTTVTVISGAIASLCVIVDGIHPRGMLRNVHLRAYHDIKNLIARVINQYRSDTTRAKPETITRRIIKDAEEERERIANYVRDAETALRYKTDGS